MTKNNLSFKYYLFCVILPLLVIISIFTFGTIYLQNNIFQTERKIVALDGINAIQYIINTSQKIKIYTNKQDMPSQDIQRQRTLFKKVLSQLKELHNHLTFHTKKYPNHEEINQFLFNINKSLRSSDMIFDITHNTQRSFDIIKDIANNSGLADDDHSTTSILVRIIANQFPYISNDIFNNNLNNTDTTLKNFNYNLQLLDSNILTIVTDNINLNIQNANKIYAENSIKLKTLLEKRIETTDRIQNFCIFLFVLGLIFIGYSYFKYNQKNNQLKNTIKEYEKVSLIDKLTSLYNRGHFDDVISRKLKSAKRDQHSVVFIVVDIDNFKKYNDIYGYKKGDTVLQVIAKVLKATLQRGSDYIFRLGDEEFGLLLTDMEFKKAVEFTAIIKHKIEEVNIEYINHKENTSHITVSMGFVFIEPGMDFEEIEIYNGAYKALETCKNKGKNTISVYYPDKKEVELLDL